MRIPLAPALLLPLLPLCIPGDLHPTLTTDHLNDNDLSLSYENVVQIASLPLHCYSTEYPNKLREAWSLDMTILPSCKIPSHAGGVL